jgi:hypothetical protein
VKVVIRFALALALAVIPLLAPVAHASTALQNWHRFLYYDNDGYGWMYVRDTSPAVNGEIQISVTMRQNGLEITGTGSRKLRQGTWAWCSFHVESSTKAWDFSGWLPLYTFSPGGGQYVADQQPPVQPWFCWYWY